MKCGQRLQVPSVSTSSSQRPVKASPIQPVVPPPLPIPDDTSPIDDPLAAFNFSENVSAPLLQHSVAKLPRRTFTLTTILGMCVLALLAGVATTVIAMRSTVPTASKKDGIAEHPNSPSAPNKSRGVGNDKAENATERRKPNTAKVADTTALTFTRDATRQLPFADPNAVMFSADGARLLAVGDNDTKEPTLLVWSTRSWEVEASSVLPTSARHLAMTHDQSMVIVFSGKDEKTETGMVTS